MIYYNNNNNNNNNNNKKKKKKNDQLTRFYAMTGLSTKIKRQTTTGLIKCSSIGGTAQQLDMAVTWTHKLSRTETQKITKYENLALEIKNIQKLNYGAIYPLVISAEGVVNKSFLKY